MRGLASSSTRGGAHRHTHARPRGRRPRPHRQRPAATCACCYGAARGTWRGFHICPSPLPLSGAAAPAPLAFPPSLSSLPCPPAPPRKPPSSRVPGMGQAQGRLCVLLPAPPSAHPACGAAAHARPPPARQPRPRRQRGGCCALPARSSAAIRRRSDHAAVCPHVMTAHDRTCTCLCISRSLHPPHGSRQSALEQRSRGAAHPPPPRGGGQQWGPAGMRHEHHCHR